MFGLGKIGVYLFIGIILAGSLTAAYKGWEYSIEQRTLLELNKTQMEQIVKDQKEYTKKQQELVNQQIAATEALAEQNKILSKKLSSVNSYLNSKEASASDRPSSDVLKNTIDQLAKAK